MTSEKEPFQLEPQDEIAAEPVGTRPPGEGRAGAGALLTAGLRLLRLHGLRAFGFALLVAFTSAGVLEVLQWMALAVLAVMEETPLWWLFYDVSLLVLLVAVTALRVGYACMMLRLLQGQKAGVVGLFAAYRSGRLWFTVTAAGGVAFLGPTLFRQVWQHVPWQHVAPALDPEAPIAQLIEQIQRIAWLRHELLTVVSILVFVPVAWAGLMAIVSRQSWWEALARSARLAFAHWRLALAFVVVVVACTFLPYLASPFAWGIRDLSGSSGIVMSWLFILASVVLGAFWLLFESVALVVVYREMVWRERLAAECNAP